MRKSRVNNKWVRQCKICQMFISKPELWIEIHDKVNKKGEPRTRVCQWLNQQVEEHNKDYPPDSDQCLPLFNDMNFQMHFVGSGFDPSGAPNVGHLQDFEQVKLIFMDERKKADLKKEKLHEFLDEDYFKDAENYLKDLNRGLTEYSSLSVMIDSLDDVLMHYDKNMKQRMADGQRVPIQEIETYQKQVRSLLEMKIQLATLRNKSTIAGEAVHTAITMTITQWFENLMMVTEEAKATLTGALPKSTIPDEVISMIRHRLSEVVKAQGDDIFDKVIRQYKIK